MMFLAVLAASSVAIVTAAPATGTCMCVTSSAVSVRDKAGLSGHVVATVGQGECYIFNGGVLTVDGHIWYELQNVHGHARVWVASEFLTASAASSCSAGSGGGGSTGSHTFATGLVSQQCLECICQQESGCRPIGCHFDVNSDSCGYFQIKNDYWTDCGRPGASWKACADDLHCASQCVQNYMKRYASTYGCAATCESYAREHNGGPRGCHSSSTLGYWHEVQRHTGCSGVH
ncbi:lysozyme-like [Dreissena polymorpha]|uniref:lysozyme n=1 Tax=Dreissena polymorpha TaxID=45954 RepID=A0A9D4MW46_DREPO|nr:lysozyme-like [Dreissena polymorpha]KAH3883433.1 hypothetical protein DPMN_007388 [Dreissena polymorpha]